MPWMRLPPCYPTLLAPPAPQVKQEHPESAMGGFTRLLDRCDGIAIVCRPGLCIFARPLLPPPDSQAGTSAAALQPLCRCSNVPDAWMQEIPTFLGQKACQR